MSWYMTPVQTRIHRWLTGALLAALFLLPLLSLGQAHAVSKTWDGGCGADTTWSCANNWSDNIVPGAADTVTFNATSTNNSTVDSATFAGTITTININAGYTGTITLARSLTVSTTFSQAAGTFNADSQTLTLAAFTLSAGSFTASSGTTNISGAMTISGSPTFTANGGTVNFNGTTTATLSCNNVTFNLVTFTHTGSTKTVNSNCSLPLGANPNITGNNATVSLNGTLSGTGTFNMVGGGGALNLNSGGSLSGFTGFTGATLAVSGTYNFGSYSPFSLTSQFTLNSGGVFTAPSGTASFNSTFTINAGSTFNANGGTINFSGSTTATLSCNNATFNLVTFTHTAGTKTVSSNCSLPLGANPTVGAGGAVILNGTLSGSGTLTKSAGSLTLNVGSSLTGFSGLIVNGAFVINGTYNFSAYTTFSAANTFSLGATGIFTAPTGTASFANTFTLNAGSTFNANGGTVNFNSTSSATLSCNNAVFNLVTFTHTAGTKTVSSNCSLPLGNNPSITGPIVLNGALSGTGTITFLGTVTLGTTGSLSGFSGLSAVVLIINGSYNFGSYSPFTVTSTFQLNSGATFTAPSGTASFKAAFTVNSGSTFNANGGTIDFTGSSSGAVIACGNKTFNLVTFTHTNNKTVSSDCSLPLGNNPTVGIGISASLILNGTLTGTGTLTTNGTLTLGSTSSLSGFSGLQAQAVVVNGATADFSAYTTFTLANDYAQTGGTVTVPNNATFNGLFTVNSGSIFNAPSGTVNFFSSFTINAGATFNANGGTVNFTGVGGGLSCNNTIFNLVTITNAGQKTVGSTCNLPLGNNPTVSLSGGTGILAINGVLSGTGTINVTGSGGFLRPQVTGALSGFSGLVAEGGVTIGSGSTTGTIDFSGYSPFTVAGQLYVRDGMTMIAPSGTASVAGNFKVDPTGTFNANGGTVVLNGTAQTITGDTTFYNLTKTVTSADTLTFVAGSTQTIMGRLTLSGSSGQLLSLVSDVPGSPWFIDAEGTTSVAYVDVADSFSTGPNITACFSVDSGGNSGWNFNPSSCNPTHGSGANATITNYELLQAYFITQAQQSQSQAAAAAAEAALPGSNSLPAKISSFLNQFPAGKGLAKAAGQFLIALVVLFILGLLVGLWLIWWHRRKQAEEEAEEYDEKPPVVKPPSWPPPSSTGTDYYNAHHGTGGQL